MNSFKQNLLIVAISLLPLISIFITKDLPHTHDGPVHLARMAAYYKALSDGQIFPRWAGDLNYGYGLPLFNFIYHLPYLVSAFFIFLGFNLVNTFKLVAAISYLLSGVFMYFFVRALLKNDRKAMLISIFYQFAPFRLVEILVRGSLAEAYVYTLLPLVLWGVTRIFQQASYQYFFLTAISTALLIVSHNSMSLVFFGISALFVALFGKTKKNYLFGCLALFSGLLLAAFYWIPAIFEHKYTYGDLFMKSIYRTHFPPLIQFFLPNFTNRGDWQTGGVSTQFGLFHTLALGLTIGLVLRKNITALNKRLFVCALIITFSGLFFMQPVSGVFWERISLLRQFQFPWRLLGAVVFATSLMSLSFFFYRLSKKPAILTLLAALTIFSTIYYWRPPLGFDKVTDESLYWNYPLNTTYFGETDVVWSAGPAKQYPNQPVEVIAGKAIVTDFKKKTTKQTFVVQADSAARLVAHTQYFPGWKVYVDSIKVPVEFQDQSWRGLITFPVPPGKHGVRIVFGNSKIRLLANSLSLSTLAYLVLLPLVLRKIRKR